MNYTGIILAGGQSSRMGTDKGLIDLNGKPMIQYVIDTLQKVVDQIIIVANNPKYKQFGFKVYPDIILEKGPVGGIYTGLFYSKTEKNIVVSCDTPNITIDLLKVLIDKSPKSGIVVSSYNNKTHPIIGVYSKSILPIFKKNLDKNNLKLSVVNQQAKYKVVNLSTIDFKDSIFKNINTQSDLKQIENEN